MSASIVPLENEPSRERIDLDSDTIVIFDLDRTLIDSGSLVDVTLLSLEDLVTNSNEDDSQVDKKTAITAIEKVRRLQKEETGNSFAYLEVLQREMGVNGTGWIKGLADNVIDANRDEHGKIKQSFINQIMLPNAIDILEKVDKSDSDWVIMTAGEQITQLYKLELLRRILAESNVNNVDDMSYFITDPDHKYSKAKMISRAFIDKDGERRFDLVLMSQYAHNAKIDKSLTRKFHKAVVLIDDKLANLDGIGGEQIYAVHAKADNRDDAEGESLADISERFSSN